jgi:hypothetical protein
MNEITDAEKDAEIVAAMEATDMMTPAERHRAIFDAGVKHGMERDERALREIYEWCHDAENDGPTKLKAIDRVVRDAIRKAIP